MEPTLYYCNTCESPVTEVEKKNHVLTCKKCNEPFVNIIDSDDSNSDFPAFLNTIADDDTKAIEPTTIQENDSSSTITKCNNNADANDATFELNSFSTPLAQYYTRKPKKRSTSKNNSRSKPNISQQFGKAIKRND
eukprot:247433_1